MKKASVVKRLGLGLLSGIGLLTCFVGCKDDEPEAPKGIEFSFNNELVADYNVVYDPALVLGEEVSVVSVEVLDPNGKAVEIDDQYKFVPRALGTHYYKLVLKRGTLQEEFVKQVRVSDKVAPTVVTKIPSLEDVELGVYSSFTKDLEKLVLSDNNEEMVKNIEKKVVQISIGNEVQVSSEGFDQFLFDQTGVYEIMVEAKDISGNAVYTTYNITTKDTTKPSITAYSLTYAWLENGKVSVPQIVTQDISSVTVTQTAKLNGADLPIEDGKMSAQVGDVIAVTYTATDASNNVSTYEMQVKVLEKGQLFDATDANLNALFTANQAIIRSTGDGLSILNDGNDTLSWKSGAYAFDSLSGFSAIAFEVVNNKPLPVLCFLNATLDGEKKCVGSFTISSKNVDGNSETFAIDFSAAGLTNVDGWSLEFSSNGGLDLLIKNAYLTNSQGYTNTLNEQLVSGKVNQEYTISVANGSNVEVLAPNGQKVTVNAGKFTPTTAGTYTVRCFVSSSQIDTYLLYVEGTNEINFENTDAFNFSQAHNGGFTSVKDNAYAGAGEYSAKATVRAGTRVGATFANPYALTGEINFVTFNVFAQLDGEIKIGFLATDASMTQKTFESGVFTLKKGANQLKFVLTDVEGTPPDAKIQTLTDVKIQSIYVKNTSRYDNIYYIDNIHFDKKDAVAETEIFQSMEGVILRAEENGEVFIPEVIACDKKFISAVSVKIFMQNGVERFNVEQPGRAVKLPSVIKAGTYIVRYTVTMLDGSTKYTKSIPLEVTEQLLNGSVSLGDYYVDVPFNLPDPTIVSEVYTLEQLEEISIKKYYKLPSGLEWIEADGEICFNANTYVDIKYMVEMPTGASMVLYNQTYIHDNGVHLDFEKWSGGEHMGIIDENSTNGTVIPSDEWAYTGKFGMRCVDYKWNTVGTVNFYNLPGGKLELNMEANAIVFWAYSQANGAKELHFTLTYRNAENKAVSYEFHFNVKKGVNKYVLPFDSNQAKSFNNCVSLSWLIPKAMLWYFDNFSFVKLGDVEYDQLTGKEYLTQEGVTVKKPVFSNPSDLVFTEKDVANVKYSVSYLKDGLTVTEYFTADKDEITIFLPKGKNVVTMSCQVADVVFKEEQTIFVRDFECAFTAPKPSFSIGEQCQIALPTSTEAEAVMSAHYRKKNETEWKAIEDVAGGFVNLTLNEAGAYEIKLTATLGSYVEEEIYNVYVRDTDVFADFEKVEGDAYHGAMEMSAEMTISDVWSYDGDYSLKVTTRYGESVNYLRYAGSDGAPISLDKSYNAITMWIYTDRVIADRWLNVEYGSKQLRSSNVTLQPGEHMYVFTFDESFDKIQKMVFRVTRSDTFYVDQIKFGNFTVDTFTIPETAKKDGTIVFDVPTSTFNGESRPVSVQYKFEESGQFYMATQNADGKFEIPTTMAGNMEVCLCVQALDDITGVLYLQHQNVFIYNFKCDFVEPTKVILEGESHQIALPTTQEEGVTMSAQYRKLGMEEWIELPVANGYATVKIDDAGMYELRLKATKGDDFEKNVYKILVRGADVFADFELENDGTHHGTGTMSEEMVISKDWAYDGEHSLMLKTRYGESVNSLVYQDVTLDKSYNAITMWIKADKEIADRWINVEYAGKSLKSNFVTLKKGTFQYVFTFEESFDKIQKMVFRVTAGDVYYIDQIKFANLEVDTLTLPTEAYRDETLSFDALTAKFNGEAKGVFVEYKFAGEEEYTRATINETTNKMEIPSLLSGLMEIRVFVEALDGEMGIVCVQSMELYVWNFNCEFIVPRTVIDVNESYLASLPKTTAQGVAMSAQYRKVGDLTWTDASIEGDFAKLQISDAGNYELKFIAKLGEYAEEAVYPLLVRSADVFADFELENDGTHHGTGTMSEEMVISKDWAYDGEHSLMLKTRYGSSVNYLQYLQDGAQKDLGGSYNAITMWINAKQDISNAWIQIEGDGKQLRSSLTNFKKGEYMYMFTFEDSISKIQKIVFEVRGGNIYYVDQIKFVSFEVDTLEIDSVASAGEPLTFDALTATLNGEQKEVCVKYKFAGEETYTDATINGEGKIEIPDLAVGLMDLQVWVNAYAGEMGTICVQTGQIYASAVNCQFVPPISVMNVGQSYEVDMPITEEDGVVMSAYYRLVGATDWTSCPVADDKATVKIDVAGNYELKIKATKGEAFEESVYDLLVRAEDVFADFELEEDGTHHGASIMSVEMVISDVWAYDGDYSLKVTTRYGESVNYLQYNDASGAPISLGGTYNAITMRIKADKEIADRWIQVEYGNKQLRSAAVDLKKGENEYTFTFSESFDQVFKLVFKVTRSDTFYVDQIKFTNVEQ